MSGELLVRVRVLAEWQDVALRLPPETPIADIKAAALAAVHNPRPPEEFVVKFRGAAIANEARSLADVGVPTEGALIVMRRHRVPVR